MEERNGIICNIFDICSPFLKNRDICTLRCVNKDLCEWSYKPDNVLRALMDSQLEDCHVLPYWTSCLSSKNLSINFDALYDRLRGYGYGEEFVKNEGVIGEILRDVNRTFPTHILFSANGGLGQLMLENVLRCISEYYPNIGYCQGMNFVVGVIILGIVDPEGRGCGDDEAIKQAIIQFTMTESQSRIEKATFGIVINLIRLLHMEGLWSFGIPELKRFIFMMQQYMKMCCPIMLTYFDDVGYDVSIIVSKWFITLFAYTLPLTLLYKLWGYVIREGWLGVIRISLGLLRYFEKEMLMCDIVELSILMKSMKTNKLQNNEEQHALFHMILAVNEVTTVNYAEFYQQYDREVATRMTLAMDYIPTIDKKEMMKRRSRIDIDIKTVRMKLEQIAEQEYALKREFKKYSGIYGLLEEEMIEVSDYKRGMLNQVESLLYLDQHMLFDPDVKEDDMATISFLRQQDVSAICGKISIVTGNIRKKRELMNLTQSRVEEIKRKWEELLREKNVLKEELLEAVKQHTRTMVCGLVM